jgi:hypothetical protein
VVVEEATEEDKGPGSSVKVVGDNNSKENNNEEAKETSVVRAYISLAACGKGAVSVRGSAWVCLGSYGGAGGRP